MVTPLLRESAKFFNMKMRDSFKENGTREQAVVSPSNELLNSMAAESNLSNENLESARR